jgi:CheY-like chemotaxis protein/anti-sigma regulatory factor (Ser/Thr protein kinase)
LADSTQIYQVTLNLATNAMHAMEGRPGRLTVSLESFQPDASFLQAHPELQSMAYTRLTVADTGKGMDAQTLARIFEPFFTTKPAGQGTGLGLSVVHGIVQAHSGIILVESQVGVGTTFRLYFPARSADAGLAEAATPRIPTGHGQTILLVDDETALTSVFERLLKRLKYQVVATSSPVVALRLFCETPNGFDLVISDLTMPEMSGLDLARQIHLVRADLPVILTSGFMAHLKAEHLAEAGVCELIQKPVSPTALAEVVQRALHNLRKN